MNENNCGKLNLSKIVRMMEREGTFVEVSENILVELKNMMEISTAAILQLDPNGRLLTPIVDVSEGMKKTFGQAMVSQFGLCGNEMISSATALDSEKVKAALEEYGLASFASVPVYINNVRAMFVVIADKERDIAADKETLDFVLDVVSIIQNIAQKKVTNNSLLSSYEVLKDILGNIGSGIIVCSKSTGTVLFENDVVMNVREVKDTIRDCFESIYKMSNIDEALKAPMEKYNSESGLWFEVKFSELKWIDGSDVIVATAADITQKKKNQQKIEYQAHNDFLTGLYNRMKCELDLRKIIRNAEKNGKKGAVFFIDLDDFKHINDGLGHQYGDILLQQIAAGISSIPGLRGHCYRMGGDEFVIIIEPEMYDGIERVIHNVVGLFSKPWYLMETEYFCTMSMGVAIFPDHSTDVHEIVRMADVAMYEAKKNGKNGYTYYDNQTEHTTVKQLDIENNMRQAIASGIDEFVVFFQPVVDVNTRECVSTEALVRWDSKALGFMGPGEFIPLAEYLGLITSIGDYVLEAACRQCKYWNDNGHPEFHVNVNLSVVQLLQKDVVDNVKRILTKTGVNPENIVLEITETFAINDMRRVLSIIRGLRELGPKIALDDFGTGYSSLNYIKQLPLDIIKVDKTFIDDIVEDDYAQAFVRLIVDLSKKIGTKIVVEGVEKREQYELLKELGVDFIQGYYFGKPVPASTFEVENFGRKLGEDRLEDKND